MSDTFPGIHVVGNGQDWFKAVGAVHEERASRDELCRQREDVRSRLNLYMGRVSDTKLISLLRALEIAAIRSDEALTEVAALKGLRPSQGLFNAMEAILLRFPEP